MCVYLLLLILLVVDHYHISILKFFNVGDHYHLSPDCYIDAQYVRCSKAFTDRDPGHSQGVFICVSVCTCRDESLAAWLFRLQSPVQYHVTFHKFHCIIGASPT